jgi:hypothetical protein
MTKKKPKAAPGKDWRSLPRKPEAQKKTAMIGIRVTPAQRDALSVAAREAGLTLVDFILAKCGNN